MSFLIGLKLCMIKRVIKRAISGVIKLSQKTIFQKIKSKLSKYKKHYERRSFFVRKGPKS